MLEESAVVTRVDDQFVFVKGLQSSACTKCHQQSSCGTSLYAKFLPNREMGLCSEIPLQVGDRVIVGIEETHLLKASLLMYLCPLLLMLTVAGLIDGDDRLTALLTFAGLAAGLYLVNYVQKYYFSTLFVRPEILRKEIWP